MAIVFYGTKRSNIGVDEFLIKCPRCNTHQWADVMVYSVYCHIYWIPFAPVTKEVFIVCNNCELRRDREPFDSTLVGNFEEIRTKFRHPFFTYTGVVIVVLIMALAIAASISK